MSNGLLLLLLHPLPLLPLFLLDYIPCNQLSRSRCGLLVRRELENCATVFGRERQRGDAGGRAGEREGGGCGWMGAGWVPSILEQVRLWQVGERVPGVTAWDRWIWVKLVNEHTAQLSWFPKLLLKSFYWQLWMLGSHCEHPREVIWALIVQKKVVFNCTAPDNWFKTKRKKENIREMISFLRSVNLTRHHVCAQGLKICMWW